MMAVLVAALMAVAPPDGQTLTRPAAQAGVAATSAPAIRRRTVRRRALPRPDLSMIADPYRSEPSYAPRKPDPQHPLLAPEPDELDGADGGLPRAAPVPHDPWAPAVRLEDPVGDGVRPHGSAR